jgi:hypothetical protein
MKIGGILGGIFDFFSTRLRLIFQAGHWLEEAFERVAETANDFIKEQLPKTR